MPPPDAAPSSSQDPKPPIKKRKQPAKTPFDNPWLLPILCGGFALWSGYDGWLNPKMEWVMFNRGLFVASSIGFVWFLRQALLEQKRERAKAQAGSGTPAS